MTERPPDRPVPRFDAYGVPATPEPDPAPAAPPHPADPDPQPPAGPAPDASRTGHDRSDPPPHPTPPPSPPTGPAGYPDPTPPAGAGYTDPTTRTGTAPGAYPDPTPPAGVGAGAYPDPAPPADIGTSYYDRNHTGYPDPAAPAGVGPGHEVSGPAGYQAQARSDGSGTGYDAPSYPSTLDPAAHPAAAHPDGPGPNGFPTTPDRSDLASYPPGPAESGASYHHQTQGSGAGYVPTGHAGSGATPDGAGLAAPGPDGSGASYDRLGAGGDAGTVPAGYPGAQHSTPGGDLTAYADSPPPGAMPPPGHTAGEPHGPSVGVRYDGAGNPYSPGENGAYAYQPSPDTGGPAGDGYRPQTPYSPGGDDPPRSYRQPPQTAAAAAVASVEDHAATSGPPWAAGSVAAPPRPAVAADPDDPPAYVLFEHEPTPYSTVPARNGRSTLSRPKTEAPTLDRPARRAKQDGDRARSTHGRTVAVLAHLGGLVTAFLLPVALYLAARERSAFVRLHAAEAFNFQLTLMLGYVGAAIVGVLFTGFAVLLVVWAVSLVMGIQAALTAETGHEYRYPFIVRFID